MGTKPNHWSTWPTNLTAATPRPKLSAKRREALRQAANIFRSNVNFAADPCENFYRYTCGSRKSDQTVWDDIFSQNFRRFADNIEHSYYGKRSLSSLWKMKTFYKKCTMFYSNINDRFRSSVEIVRIVNEFATQSGLQMTMFNDYRYHQTLTSSAFAYAIGYLSSIGVDTLLTPLVYADWMNPARYKLYIDQPTLFWPRSSYIEPSARKSVVSDGTLNQHITSFLYFEKTLAQFYMADEADRRNYSRLYNPFYRSYNQFFINVHSYFNGLSINNKELKQYLQQLYGDFIIMEPELLARLSRDLFKLFDSSLLINYLFFRLIASRAMYLPHNNFGNPRENCARKTLTFMKYANARVFSNSITPNERKRKKLERMVKKLSVRVVANYYKMLRRSLRRNPMAIERVTQKIGNLALNIGVPPISTNDYKLEIYYNKLQIHENDSFIQMLETLQSFNIRTKFHKLTGYVAVDRKLHCGEPAAPNSWFDYARNSLTVPIGMFVHPFYDPRWPASINYGSLAATIGHEVSHGFDDVGRQFDENGKLNNWLEPEARRVFDKTMSCVIRKYNKMCPLQGTEFHSLCLNGRKTAAENIADIAGLIVAWNSYKELDARSKKEYLRLPGSEFDNLTHDQLFFISFAQPWCRAKPSKKTLLSEILQYQHSPPEYRVITALQNFLPFRKTFHCPIVNRRKQKSCGVWG
uniref:Peptidase_M13 domain-containing protein n=1 Tax=Syphacia muris TaxID=451379 RepID=A0A0N5AI18_9BILA